MNWILRDLNHGGRNSIDKEQGCKRKHRHGMLRVEHGAPGEDKVWLPHIGGISKFLIRFNLDQNIFLS